MTLTPSARLAAAIAASVSPRLTMCCPDFVGADTVDFDCVTFVFASEAVSENAFDAFAVLGTEFFAASSATGAALFSATTPAFSLRTPLL